ncbi:MAG: hypothetical protein AAFV77_11935, partial [Planctomycetota bacterium]
MLGDLGRSCSRRGAVKPAVIIVVTLVVVVGAIFIKGMAGAVAAFAAEERGREEITAIAQELSADG